MSKYPRLIAWLAVASGGVLTLVSGMGNPGLSILGIFMFIGGMYQAADAA
jgi:hypothetical protein